MLRLRLLTVLLPTLLLAACRDRHDVFEVRSPNRVGITVEVRSGGVVLEGVSVVLVSVDHEWSNCTCVSPFTVEGFTNSFGRVRIDSHDFADAEIGFHEDGLGHAVLYGRWNEDECRVALDIDAAQYGSARVFVDLSWHEPDRLVVIDL